MAQENGKEMIFDGLPSTLRIGPFDLAVEVKDKINDDEDAGVYNHGLSIELRTDQHNSAVFALDTVLHEVGHGIYRTFGLDKKSSEESIVTAMATGWAMVYRDNPAFVNWLYRMIAAPAPDSRTSRP